MLRKDDERLFLIDFGIAKRVQSALTHSTSWGTEGYAPIEQCQGEPEVRSDLYALGATMHYLLSGRPPVPFKFPAIRSLRPEISAEMEAVLEKALKLHAHERYQSAREMREALEGIACLMPGEKSKSIYSPLQKAATTIKNSRQNIKDKNIRSKPLNLSLVIDISKSMYLDQKLMFVIDAINDIVDILMPEDFFSIVAFADECCVIVSSTHILDKETTKNTVANIATIEADVGAPRNMLNGIEIAMKEILKSFSEELTNHIIIITDGIPLGEKECLEKCREARRMGISCSTFGIGDDFNEKFLIDIDNFCGGHALYEDIPRYIPKTLALEFHGIKTCQ